ncbi:MAG: sulfatase-like hydrolase/transferase, partial [Verrucomicrobiota bacterium]
EGIAKARDNPDYYHGADDARCWVERYNSPGPEWKAPGKGETLQRNPDGTRPVVGGNTFVVVEAEGGDRVHSDGKTAAKAAELLRGYANDEKPFWLGVGFVRPHVPFVAPEKYFEPFLPYEKLELPEKVEDDWDDIPKPGINYCTAENMQMDLRKQKKAVGGYYASVRYVDAMVGEVLTALEESGKADETIIIFTSDHGFHLGEHDFWAKVSLRDESSGVPLIISVPGREAGVSDSFVELLDLYPTTASLCGLEVPERLQGKDISPLLDDPALEVRKAAFSVAPMRKGFLLRERDWAFIQYGEEGQNGMELFDLRRDPRGFTNLAESVEHASVVSDFQRKMREKLVEVRDSDLAEK